MVNKLADKDMCQQIGTEKGLPAFAIEKGWWVVQTLSVVFQLEIARSLLFKGGTSLSKAWNVIDRFSEDIDLAMDRSFFRFDGNLSKNQRDKLKKISGKYVDENFYPELMKRLTATGFTDFKLELEETPESDRDRKINLYYPNVIDSPGYLQPRVQLELSSRSLRESFTVKTFSSFVDEAYPEKAFTTKLGKCRHSIETHPIRKITLVRGPDIFQKKWLLRPGRIRPDQTQMQGL